MSNLYPEHTGLPMTVGVRARGGARHDARIKVSCVHGPRADGDGVVVVGVRPRPRLLHGDLRRRDLDHVVRRIELNSGVIIDHREGRASSVVLARRLQRLPD